MEEPGSLAGSLSSGKLHQRIVGALHRELVGCGDERQAGQFGDLGGRRFGKAGRGVDAGADRGAAERQAIDALQGRFDPLQIVRQHRGIAGPFLPQGERGRILQMSAPDLDDLIPGVGLAGDRIA